MKRLMILILVVLILASCDPFGGMAPVYDFPDIPYLGFTSVESVLQWAAFNIRYVPDTIHYPDNEYWQSPIQTYIWRSGDCEDFAILSLYLIKTHLGIEGQMISGSVSGTGHAWISINGAWWEPQIFQMVLNPENYVVWETLSYHEAIGRSTTVHRSVD